MFEKLFRVKKDIDGTTELTLASVFGYSLKLKKAPNEEYLKLRQAELTESSDRMMVEHDF